MTDNALIIISIYLVLVNASALFLCAKDKYCAARGLRRTKESTLLGLSALGGALFMLIGMYTFRHKTKKPKFTLLVPLFLVMHIVLAFLLEIRFGLFSSSL